jgi:hypothetical protein
VSLSGSLSIWCLEFEKNGANWRILVDVDDDELYAAAKDADVEEDEDAVDDDFHLAMFASNGPASKPTLSLRNEKFMGMGMGTASATSAMAQSSTRMSGRRLNSGTVMAQPFGMMSANAPSMAPASNFYARAPPPPSPSRTTAQARIRASIVGAAATPPGMGPQSAYGSPAYRTAHVMDQNRESKLSAAGSPPAPIQQKEYDYPLVQTHQSRQYFGPASGSFQFSSVVSPSYAMESYSSSSGQAMPKLDLFTTNDTSSAIQPQTGSSMVSPAFGRAPPAQPSAPKPDMRSRIGFSSAPISLGWRRGRGGYSQAHNRKSSRNTSNEEIDYVAPVVDWSSKSFTEKVARLIELQTFDGSWAESEEIASILGFKEGVESKEGVDKGVWITLLVVKWFEIMASEEEGVWEMLVEKARGWFEGCGVMNVEELEQVAAREIEKLKSDQNLSEL